MNNPLKNIHSGKTSIENGQFTQKYSYSFILVIILRDIPRVFVNARKG